MIREEGQRKKLLLKRDRVVVTIARGFGRVIVACVDGGGVGGGVGKAIAKCLKKGGVCGQSCLELQINQYFTQINREMKSLKILSTK